MAKQKKTGCAPARIKTKDLITVGIFAAIYFVLYFLTGMMAFVPALVVVAPLVGPLVTGIPFMLFLTKVRSFGMVSIMGVLLGIVFAAGTQNWTSLPLGLAFGLAADLVLKTGGYRGWGSTVVGYVVFSEWALSGFVPLFFMREAYSAQLRAGWGDAYVDSLLALSPPWFFLVIVAMIAAGAVMGAYGGRAVLKKHFKRAGIA